jgi:hypothetical protein
LRVGAWAVLGIAAAITVMMVTLFVGMRRNDASIEANPGTATATVLSVGLVRTGIEFVTADGLTVRPPGGVLYPGLLSPGQKFLVEYSTADADLVRVAGRNAAVGNIMIAVVVAVTWLIAWPLVYLLRRWSGLPLLRRRRAPGDPLGTPEIGPMTLDDAADPPTIRIPVVLPADQDGSEGPHDSQQIYRAGAPSGTEFGVVAAAEGGTE